MSKMAELSYDIEQLWIEGLNAGQIARELGCHIELVFAWITENINVANMPQDELVDQEEF